MTFESAARLDPDEESGELEAGRWVPVTKNTWRHGEVAGNVYQLLRDYARRHPGWRVAVGDPGTKLGHDPDILRGPDVAMVREERAPRGRGAAGWLEGAPDVVAEVAGDSQSASKLAEKAREYLAAGALAVWIVDAEAACVTVFSPPDRKHYLDLGEILDGGDALPGFSCPVEAFFD